MTKKLFDSFYRLGLFFGKNNTFDEDIVRSLAKRERMSGFTRTALRLLAITGLTNFYWDTQLKKNNAYENRFDKPYEENLVGSK
jgi:hypothetical protein